MTKDLKELGVDVTGKSADGIIIELLALILEELRRFNRKPVIIPEDAETTPKRRARN